MVLALDTYDLGGLGLSGARGAPSSNWDILQAGRRAQALGENVNSMLVSQEEAYDRRIDDILRATGVRLRNPARDRTLTFRQGPEAAMGALFSKRVARDLDERLSPDDFMARLARLAEEQPDFRDIIRPDLDPREDAKRLAREAERQFQDLSSRGGTGSTLAGVAGVFLGALQDPAMLATMFVGDPGAGRSLMVHAMRAAAINATVEAGLQPIIQSWRAEAGMEAGVLRGAQNVALAGAFGAGIDVVGRSLYRGARVWRGGKWIDEPDQALALDEAARRLPADNPIRKAYEGDGAPLADVLERADDPSIRDLAQRANDARLFERYGIADEWSHLENTAQALRRAEMPDMEPPPGRALEQAPEARTPRLTDDAPAPGRRFDVDGRPVTFGTFTTRNIVSDPATFQFKGGGDAAGVTERLGDVMTWDDLAAGKIVIFERADGTRVIADGHQRLGLAKRIEAETGEAPKIDGYRFREADGWTPDDVRALAAKKNLQEGSGDVIDAARVMRARPDIVDASMPMTSGMMRTARSLGRLSDEAFDAVAAGVVPANFGALVGDLVPDASRHLGIIEELAALAPDNAQQARIAINEMMSVPARVETQLTLLGAETRTRSLLRERMQVLDAALKHLRADARIFGLLDREAARIEGAGNRLADGNRARADEAAQMTELVVTLALSSGRVSDLLNEAAARVAGGTSARIAGEAFARRVGVVLDAEGLAGLTRANDPPALRGAGDDFDEPGGEAAKRQVEDLEQRVLLAVPRNDGALRADEFDTSTVYYHGTMADFTEFDLRRAGESTGTPDKAIFLTTDPAEANNYAFGLLGDPIDGGRIVSAFVRGNIKELRFDRTLSLDEMRRAADIRQAQSEGFDGVTWLNVTDAGDAPTTVTAIFDAKNVRLANFHALSELSAAAAPTHRARAEMPAIRAEIDRVIERLPDDVRLDLADAVTFRGQDVDGMFDPHDLLFRVSLAAEDPARIARHEEIHVYRKLGLLRDSEWAALTARVDADGLRAKYKIDERYKGLYAARFEGDAEGLERALVEETIAEMWADRVGGATFGGTIDRIIDRVLDVLRRVRQVLTGRGYLTAEDVFRRIETGEVGRREVADVRAAEADARAAEVVEACRR